MTDTIRVFVNASAVDLPVGADVRSAVHAFDPTLADRVGSGDVLVTDARGIELAPGARLAAGAILRVIVSARR